MHFQEQKQFSLRRVQMYNVRKINRKEDYIQIKGGGAGTTCLFSMFCCVRVTQVFMHITLVKNQYSVGIL